MKLIPFLASMAGGKQPMAPETLTFSVGPPPNPEFHSALWYAQEDMGKPVNQRRVFHITNTVATFSEAGTLELDSTAGTNSVGIFTDRLDVLSRAAALSNGYRFLIDMKLTGYTAPTMVDMVRFRSGEDGSNVMAIKSELLTDRIKVWLEVETVGGMTTFQSGSISVPRGERVAYELRVDADDYTLQVTSQTVDSKVSINVPLPAPDGGGFFFDVLDSPTSRITGLQLHRIELERF